MNQQAVTKTGAQRYMLGGVVVDFGLVPIRRKLAETPKEIPIDVQHLQSKRAGGLTVITQHLDPEENNVGARAKLGEN